jgi:hypothetical protein
MTAEMGPRLHSQSNGTRPEYARCWASLANQAAIPPWTAMDVRNTAELMRPHIRSSIPDAASGFMFVTFPTEERRVES